MNEALIVFGAPVVLVIVVYLLVWLVDRIWGLPPMFGSMRPPAPPMPPPPPPVCRDDLLGPARDYVIPPKRRAELRDTLQGVDDVQYETEFDWKRNENRAYRRNDA